MFVLCALLLTAGLDDEARFTDARARFAELDYEGALALLDQLVAEPRPDAERARVLVWTGAARALLGDESAGRLAFENALRLDREIALEMSTSPKVVALFDTVKAQLPPPDPPAAAPAPPTPPLVETALPQATPAAPPPVAPDEPARQEERGGGALWWAVAGAGALTGVAGGVASAYFFADVASKMGVANDKSTSQLEAVTLVGEANDALWVAGGLAGAAVALLAVGGVGTALALGE